MTIEVYTRKAKFAELKAYCLHASDGDFMEVCEWHNGEGFDVTINDRTLQFTYGQWDCLRVLVNYKDQKYSLDLLVRSLYNIIYRLENNRQRVQPTNIRAKL